MSSCTERSRRRQPGTRRRARGAAMVEAVIVVMVLTLLFVGIVFLGGLYKAKLLAMQDARSRNMYNATNSCEPNGFTAAAGDDSGADPPSLPQEAAGLGIDFLHDIVQGGGVSRTNSTGAFSFGPARAPKDDPQPIAPRYVGTVKARSYTLCNEKRLGISVQDLIAREFKLMKQTLGTDVESLFSDLF